MLRCPWPWCIRRATARCASPTRYARIELAWKPQCAILAVGLYAGLVRWPVPIRPCPPLRCLQYLERCLRDELQGALPCTDMHALLAADGPRQHELAGHSEAASKQVSSRALHRLPQTERVGATLCTACHTHP